MTGSETGLAATASLRCAKQVCDLSLVLGRMLGFMPRMPTPPMSSPRSTHARQLAAGPKTLLIRCSSRSLYLFVLRWGASSFVTRLLFSCGTYPRVELSLPRFRIMDTVYHRTKNTIIIILRSFQSFPIAVDRGVRSGRDWHAKTRLGLDIHYPKPYHLFTNNIKSSQMC